MSASGADALLSASGKIGRYFSLTSALPSFLFVLWVYILLASGAAGGRPELDKVAATLRQGGISGILTNIAGLVLAAVVVGLFMHPLQYGMTQLLEGYWGPSRLAVLLGSTRANFHRERARSFDDRASHSDDAALRATGLTVEQGPGEQYGQARQRLQSYLDDELETEPGDRLMPYIIAFQEARRRRSHYPNKTGRIMPTRLGNALRRYEDQAGSQYEIDAIAVASHLAFVAKREHQVYVDDALQQMDTSLRLCAVALMATAVTVGMLLTDGPWLFIALVPYLSAYLAYRGSVAAARGYGVVAAARLDLNRFALYDALRLPKPASLRAECLQNKKMMAMLSGDGEIALPYQTDRPPPIRDSLRSRGAARR